MKFTKPYIYFWITAIFILLVGLVNYKSDDAININIHDTYFIISTTHLTIAISILFFIIGLIYWILGKTTLKLYPRLTQIHTFVSIGSFVAFTMGMLYFSKIKIETLQLNYSFTASNNSVLTKNNLLIDALIEGLKINKLKGYSDEGLTIEVESSSILNKLDKARFYQTGNKKKDSIYISKIAIE